MKRLSALILCSAWLSSGVMYAQQAQPPQTQPPAVPDTAREAEGLISEPGVIARAALFADRHFGNGEMTNGLYLDSFNMVPGAGWISIGPGYRRWMRKDSLFVDASTAISWHGFKTAQARFELPKLMSSRLAAGVQFKWQDFPQLGYFGEGTDSSEFNLSEYRLRSTNLVGFATFRPTRWLDIGGRLGYLEPTILPRAGNFMGDEPDTGDVFAGDVVYAVGEQPTFMQSEAFVAADTRDFPGHPTRGTVARASWTQYSDRDRRIFSFKQYELEGGQFIPVADARVVLAVRGWLVSTDPNEGQTVPFYLQPSLGGHNSLRAFASYRFHDRNALLLNAEARVALMRHIDAAVFMDAGNVASTLDDLNLDKRSYGFGLRFHSRRQTFARVDVARGQEGWRTVFRLTEPLALTRWNRATANVPFVP